MKTVGKVTDEERLAIWEINCHKTSLEELMLVLPHDSTMYARAAEDYARTLLRYQAWWDENYAKYGWEKGPGNWKILFASNEIVIE